MPEKSLVNYAYEVLTANGDKIKFADLWNETISAASLTEEEASKRIGQFYTNLSVDGRFVCLQDNEWDLSERHKYDDCHTDMTAAYADDVAHEDASTESEEDDSDELMTSSEDDSDVDPEE